MSFCSLLDLRTPTLGLLFGALFSDGSGSINVPGPIDFLGGLVLAFGLLKELGGKWLCLRLLSTGLLTDVVIDSELDLLGMLVVEFCCLAAEFFLPIEDTVEVFLTLDDGCGSVRFSSKGLFGALGPLPGRGKWLRLGSSVVMLSWKSSKLTGARKSPKSRGSLSDSSAFCGSCGIIDAKLNLDTLLIENCCECVFCVVAAVLNLEFGTIE